MTLTPADNCVTSVSKSVGGDGTIHALVRSCKGHEHPLQLVIDFDGEGTEWAPYTINIDESDVALNVPEGDPADLGLTTELPESVSTITLAYNVNSSLIGYTTYNNGTVTISGNTAADVISDQNLIQFFMTLSKGNNVGVAIENANGITHNANGITYHVFDSNSDIVAVDGDTVYISQIVELSYNGQLSYDDQKSFTIYTLEAGPDGTYNLAKAYTINVESTVYVTPAESFDPEQF